jgi:hypothetical protein
MERKQTSKRILLGGGVLAGVAVVVALSLGQDVNIEAVAEAPAQELTGTSSPEDTQSGSVAGQRARASTAPAMAQQGPKLPPMPEELIEQILKEDKKLGMFMYYRKHVLLDEQGRNEYRKILADPEMMAEMAKGLKASGQGAMAPKEYYHRLMQVDYFEAALTWNDNPNRQKLLEVVGGVILEDNFLGGMDLERRQMLAGTKLELYRLMHETHMKSAMDLVEQARGTRMEKLVSWLAAEDLRRSAQEAEIRAAQASLK